ncbi:malonate decarboxylase gamma subunit [Kaistia soli DSM 19436]|uniref:Malonate decarboxylase gamma subunit n=1 Tax=Kaistia soli DSM 19436 TaxID=1122133 RepID=A0A1M5L4F7_9HYPH|nr:biotin-independent malonate decarboxylase subunit gamma [Kaistia soli]SHG59830.1 malonate decarboxylase gamma subunit [Kaistia soli DSM 19436]
MTLADLLASLFPSGHDIHVDKGVLVGSARLPDGSDALVLGVTDHAPIGVDEAIVLAKAVMDSIDRGTGPILVLVDSGSQRMSKRDELLGLNEYLSHLAKALILADLKGRPTIGILYGHSAAGAFLATALATRVLVAIPGAEPAVMDLPSMSRVTKLPIEVLEEKAKSTAVFAPGLDNLAKTGAVYAVWGDRTSLDRQLGALLAAMPDTVDRRGALGKERGGRTLAADIAARVRHAGLSGARD